MLLDNLSVILGVQVINCNGRFAGLWGIPQTAGNFKLIEEFAAGTLMGDFRIIKPLDMGVLLARNF